MASVTRQDLLQAAQARGYTQDDARDVLLGLLAEVVHHVGQGRRVELRGFGTFHAKERKPRPARNPRTGEVVMLPRRKVMLCRLSPEILRGRQKTPERLDTDDKRAGSSVSRAFRAPAIGSGVTADHVL